jgi:glucokinase
MKGNYMSILVGDIGGTKVNLAICDVDGGTVSARLQRRYASTQFPGIAAVVEQYLKDVSFSKSNIEAACFGVPGPVVDGAAVTVNLPWQLRAREIQAALGVFPVVLVNDLEAAAHGIRTLDIGRGLFSVREAGQSGSPIVPKATIDHRANQALMSPGTGLGEAFLFWDGVHERHVVSASEGGHCDFGPQDAEQIELLKWLWPRHKHVSWEHVASGPAIHRIYRFLKETDRYKETPELAQALSVPGVDPSPIITKSAIRGDAAIAVHTMDLWLFCVGAEAGNLALKGLSYGGVFIGGGVVPHILDLFKRPAFLNGFEAKGRMSGILKPMPIYAVTDSHTGLYGAALAATIALESSSVSKTEFAKLPKSAKFV